MPEASAARAREEELTRLRGSAPGATLFATTRYPNGFAQGKPGDDFAEKDSILAIQQAEAVLAFCRRHVP